MRNKIRQLMKRSLSGFAALAMAVGCVSAASIPAQATEAGPVPVSNFTSHIPGEIVLENTGGDNLVLLQPLSAEDEFVFGADVTFTNPDEQQSAALIFGIKENNLDDGHAIKANIHKKIDWNVPARVWGYGTDELRCPGENGQANAFFQDNRIDVTQKFRMEVSVQKNSDNRYVLTYSLTNTDGEKVTVAQGILNDSYTGGRFGLMTYSSRAVFSNITVDGQKYGALESAEGSLTIHGVNGDAHIVSDVKLESEQGFTYETDIDLAADTCSAAITFGIQNKENPGEAWIGANFNFNDNNGAGGARVFQVHNGATDIGGASLEGKLDRFKTIHVKLHVSATGLLTYELYNADNAENKVIVTRTLGNYQGGYLGLTKEGDKYVLTETPINGYETLREMDKKQEWAQVTVEENNTLLKDFVGDTYEIIAKFYPEAGTRKVGFKVRSGEGEETLVIYDLENQRLSLDRSNSGIIISGRFAEAESQAVNVNGDGTVDLHIYVDKASVEVFAMGYTATGAEQIFPSPPERRRRSSCGRCCSKGRHYHLSPVQHLDK